MKAIFFLLFFAALTSFSMGEPTRNHSTIKDSLLKKYDKFDNVLITSSGNDAISSIFLYKKGRKWKGVLFTDASIVDIVDGSSRYKHILTTKLFEADTIGRKVFALGLDSLKQYTQIELANFYRNRMKEIGNQKIEYDLPHCSHGGLISILYKGKTISYSDCYSYSKELRELPELKSFFEITSFVLIQVYIKLDSKK